MKKTLTNNLSFKVLSVIFAVVVWLAVMNIDDPNKTVIIKGIPVNMLNDELIVGNSQVYEIKAGETCSVSVTGPRSIVDALSAEDFVASADFSEISQTNAVPITVTLSQSNMKYEDKLTVVQKINTMKLSVEKVISKEYSILVEYLGDVALNHQLSAPDLSIKKVTITAAESIVSSIETVKAVINVDKLASDFKTEVALTLYNAAGDQLQYSSDKMNISVSRVTVSATMNMIKEIPVKYTVENGTYGDYVVTGSSIDKEMIKIFGKKTDVSKVTEVVIPDEYTDVEETGQLVFDIGMSQFLPEGVEPYEGYENVKITVATSNIVTKSFVVNYDDIMIRKIPEGFGASIMNDGTVTIKVRGMESLFADFTADDLVPHVDLSGAVEGENTFKLLLTLQEGMTQLEQIDIKVSITKKQDEIIENETE